MSRKDLSRTVIEGGRYYHNCFFRRASHGIERATTRDWLNQVADDVDEADATAPPPIRPVRKMFHDKLAPARRWLLAQVGRPWNKVYSDLRARFDSRTIAGAHVVNDHMLTSVRYHHEPEAPRHDLFIDRHGILRHRTELSYKKLRAEASAWAAGRVCALTYRGWWWFERRLIGHCWTTKCTEAHVIIPLLGGQSERYHEIALVSDRAMTRGERRYLERLPGYYRAKLVIPSPWPAR